MNEVKKVVLAYSGGLDTSVIVRWLIETYRCEVICFAADIGQKEELSGLREKAIKTGAAKIYIDDLREEFVRDFVFPALRANAIYEGTYLLGTSLARPLIAKRQLEIAKIEGADAVCHGATGKGNDQVRFELTYMALHPAIRIISAWRDDRWTFDSRASMIDYAEKHGIPIPLTRRSPTAATATCSISPTRGDSRGHLGGAEGGDVRPYGFPPRRRRTDRPMSRSVLKGETPSPLMVLR